MLVLCKKSTYNRWPLQIDKAVKIEISRYLSAISELLRIYEMSVLGRKLTKDLKTKALEIKNTMKKTPFHVTLQEQ